MILVAIDPGVSTGWARFVDKWLSSCGLGDPPIDHENMAMPTDVIIEVPQVYRGHLQKGDPNDLITLAVQVGRYAQRSKGLVRLVKPAEWKGQVLKEIHGARVLEVLDDAERGIVALGARPKSKAHNVLDAVGLGLWALGRMKR